MNVGEKYVRKKITKTIKKKQAMGTLSTVNEIRPYSAKDLAGFYGVCDKTFKKWISPFLGEIGIKNGRFYTVAQVKIIFDKLDLPCNIV
jgi:hypothetical protein